MLSVVLLLGSLAVFKYLNFFADNLYKLGVTALKIRTIALPIGISFYTFQIYFDFSGYSDMAIGLGRIFGFHFLENFNYLYIAKSVTEFWRRWHISLSTWFRDYVYIPLGGNRVPKGRWILNILIVWTLTGFWHGAQWNFVLWDFTMRYCCLRKSLFGASCSESFRSCCSGCMRCFSSSSFGYCLT